jgi:hypothetical protein
MGRAGLDEAPTRVTWPAKHFLFVERTGASVAGCAREAWTTLHPLLPTLRERHAVFEQFALYRPSPVPLYRAGVAVAEAPSPSEGALPEGVQYALLHPVTYHRFVLTGPYSQLPEAVGRAIEIVRADPALGLHPKCGDGDGVLFAERYVNSPLTTPEDQLITEILIPARPD